MDALDEMSSCCCCLGIDLPSSLLPMLHPIASHQGEGMDWIAGGEGKGREGKRGLN